MDKRGLWQAVLGELELTISKANFGTWFDRTSILSSEDGHVVIGAPNIFTLTRLKVRYNNAIQEVLSRMTKVETIEYKLTPSEPAPVAADPFSAPVLATEPIKQSAKPTSASAPSSSLSSKYTFDSFVVGSSNELAYAACQAVAKSPGTKYNPLFLYGGVGLGKTHLMQAVGNEILRRDSSKKIEYVTSEEFTNQFVNSIRNKKIHSFTNKFRDIDVLIIDDMQFLGTKEKTQEAFFHTFNALHQANKQIIISSDKPPKAIPSLEERLRSRFESGMIADIQPPDLETRAAILESKAAAVGAMLPPEVVEYLSRNIKQNIRELEGALTQLMAHCEFLGVEPNVATVTGILGNIAMTKPKLKPLSARLVIERTALYYDLAPDDITGPKRDKEIVLPRQVAMYLMRHEMNLSFPKIAKAVGGRDHTTAMHSVTKVEKLVEADEMLRSDITAVKERLFV